MPLSLARSPLRRLVLSLGLGVRVLAPGSAAHAAPSFTGLGHLPTQVTSRAMAVSSDGSVVVGLGYRPNASQEGFRWSAATGLESISALPQSTLAYSVSGNGAIVGGYTESLIDAKAYTWTEGGGATLLFARGSLMAGNADGSVFAGDALDGGTHQHHAVRWTPGGGSRSIEPHNVALNYSRSFGIDATGDHIVGDAAFPNLPGTRAFLWDATNGMVNIGSPDPAVGSSRANAISADASTVVGTAMPGGSGNSVAFRWTAAGGMDYLHLYTTASEAFGVSADGSVIVGTHAGDAFLWRADIGMVPVASLLGGLADGWHLVEAHAVSADGTVLVGYGTNPQGQQEAWRAEVALTVAGVAPGSPRGALAVSSYPNPARGVSFVRASGATSAHATANVLDVTGRVVRTLGEPSGGGSEALWSWDGRDRDGHRAAPGVYLVTVRAGNEERIARVLRLP